jgi:hypothetical protein
MGNEITIDTVSLRFIWTSIYTFSSHIYSTLVSTFKSFLTSLKTGIYTILDSITLFVPWVILQWISNCPSAPSLTGPPIDQCLTSPSLQGGEQVHTLPPRPPSRSGEQLHSLFIQVRTYYGSITWFYYIQIDNWMLFGLFLPRSQ